MTPAKPNAVRNPTCSPSQPPSRAPGPAGNRISQRMVLVMRPSIGAGVTDCRSDRKLMKMKTAPTPNDNSMNAYAGDAEAIQRRRGEHQPAAAADGESEHQRRSGAQTPNHPITERAGGDGADPQGDVAQADAALGQPQLARGEQDLNDHRGLIAHLPYADTDGHGHEQLVAAHEAQALAHGRPEGRVLAARRFLHRHAAQNRRGDEQQQRVREQRERRAGELDQRAGRGRSA